MLLAKASKAAMGLPAIIKDIPPAKYKPCLKFEDTKKEYSKILDEIDKWTNELRGYLYKENLDDDIIKIIDVEVK